MNSEPPDVEPTDPHRCICVVDETDWCHKRATQEDMLCDRCRAGHWVDIIDISEVLNGRPGRVLFRPARKHRS